MDKKEFIQMLRANRIIKGNRPAYIFLRKNFGNIYKGRRSDYIFSISKHQLFFQKVTLFKGLKPKSDFILNVNDFIHYKIINYNMLFNSLCLYDKEGNFIEINYETSRKDSYETEVNMNDIVKRLEEAGLTELVYDSEEENEESNN